jgi:hypothetical protein
MEWQTESPGRSIRAYGALRVLEDTDDPRTPSPERCDAAIAYLLNRRDGCRHSTCSSKMFFFAEPP